MKRIATAWLVLALVVAAGSAAASVKSQGKGGPSKTPPTITVSGDITVGGASVIDGTGFASRKAVYLVFDDGTLPILVETSRDGTFSTSWSPAQAGSTTITAFQLKKKNGWEHATTAVVDVGS